MKKVVMKRGSLFHHQDFSYKVGLMILQTQGITMEDIETLMCFTKQSVINFLLFSQFLLKWISFVDQKASRISFNILVTI